MVGGFSTAEAHHQYGRGCTGRARSVTPSVRRSHNTIMEEGAQYGSVTPSVRWGLCSTDQSSHHYGGECAA